ncbi:hypothetical protein FHS83_003482 [Rhizomicrobium palustre]|uniref:Uncharacterized protein n=1 Tax=Rhizomicrobium palustre TaxID=189966 RepID=A0A846N2E5_9PROT|nr:hypothetical protein [Rhizomicrobium palustre]NIK90164.1 hypothetical protein [Rhizomicrobium palustre]
MTHLDALLSQPLAPVADNGFSVKVMLRVQREQQRRMVLLGFAITAMVLLLALLIPASALTQLAAVPANLNALLVKLSGSVQFGIAIIVLVLVYLYDRKLLQF